MTPDKSNRYLTVRILYHRPEYKKNILDAVRKVSEAAAQFNGLVEIGAWFDKENDCIINMSLWESEKDAVKARAEMHSAFADIPWNEWERQPAENFVHLVSLV